MLGGGILKALLAAQFLLKYEIKCIYLCVDYRCHPWRPSMFCVYLLVFLYACTYRSTETYRQVNRQKQKQ